MHEEREKADPGHLAIRKGWGRSPGKKEEEGSGDSQPTWLKKRKTSAIRTQNKKK